MTNASRLLPAAAMTLLSALAATGQTIPNNVTIRNFFKSGNDSLTFNRPVLVKPYPAEDSAFVVLQQNGRVVTVRWDAGLWRKTDSASVTVLNGTSSINEEGLLGFAFHPDYMQNRKYYVYFVGGTAQARLNVLAERTAGESLRPATGDAQRTILRITDPYDNHNGGTIGFDSEGHLVLAIGDGGTTQGDPQNRAQNRDSLHGKFLRLDVDSPDAYPSDTTRNYAIPATNPFKDSANIRPEIWALGLRNPWKWSFHPVTGEIWVGDVGQSTWEEISRVPKGSNLGWRIREGIGCFNPSTNCQSLSAGFQAPALALPTSQATCITGGTFYKGDPASPFDGAYIFGDHGSHRVWAARVQGDSLVNLTQIGSVNKVVSFDRDRQGRILATTISPTTGFIISSNIGRVLLLDSPDMPPVSISGRSPNGAEARPAITWAMIRANPGRYVVTTLDGKTVRGVPSGAFIVRDRVAGGSPRLMSVLR